MPLRTLSDLYADELKDLYSAENQILKAMPKIIKAATHEELKKGFTDHLEQTKVHVERLTQICDDLGVNPKGKKCNGMEGILVEAAEFLNAGPVADVVDAGLASMAQRVEHYEMAGYGSVRTWAKQLGFDKHVTLLQQTLDEEKRADQFLTHIATTKLNIEAQGETVRGEGFADLAPGTTRSTTKRTKPDTRGEADMR
jgi:ferritin-like metal-binding protein YciE